MKENTHDEISCEQKQETVGLECKLFDVCFRYYEKAIEGRNFHYQNYNTWVNYYSLFTGALFVGYRSIIDESGGLLPCLITLLGYITSICWHLTVKGHYHWMNSWIKVVQSYEKELSDMLKNMGQKRWQVYSVYSNSDYNMYHKNISSQKLTSIFTLIVCLAWSVLLFVELKKVDLFVKFVSVLEFKDVYIIVGTMVTILLITVICLLVLPCPFSSTIVIILLIKVIYLLVLPCPFSLTIVIILLITVICLCFLDNPSDVSEMEESVSKKIVDCL